MGAFQVTTNNTLNHLDFLGSNIGLMPRISTPDPKPKSTPIIRDIADEYIERSGSYEQTYRMMSKHRINVDQVIDFIPPSLRRWFLMQGDNPSKKRPSGEILEIIAHDIAREYVYVKGKYGRASVDMTNNNIEESDVLPYIPEYLRNKFCEHEDNPDAGKRHHRGG